jgi:ribosomal protein L37AE/L43A
MKGNAKEGEKEEARMELKYCERCGSLWLRECGAGVVYCDNCQPEVADLPLPKKKPGRIKTPVRRHTLVEEYGMERVGEDEIDFEAAGGAA